MIGVLQDAELFLGREHFEGFSGEGGGQDHLPEILGHDLGDLDPNRTVEGHDTAKGADGVAGLRPHEGLQGMGSLAHTTGVVVLDDDAGRGRELPDQARSGVRIQQIVEAQFLPLVLVAGSHALGLAAGFHIEGSRLVGVLSIA